MHVPDGNDKLPQCVCFLLLLFQENKCTTLRHVDRPVRAETIDQTLAKGRLQSPMSIR